MNLIDVLIPLVPGILLVAFPNMLTPKTATAEEAATGFQAPSFGSSGSVSAPAIYGGAANKVGGANFVIQNQKRGNRSELRSWLRWNHY
jgi:hypothetical protein